MSPAPEKVGQGILEAHQELTKRMFWGLVIDCRKGLEKLTGLGLDFDLVRISGFILDEEGCVHPLYNFIKEGEVMMGVALGGENFSKLFGTEYFSTSDGKQGYYEVEWERGKRTRYLRGNNFQLLKINETRERLTVDQQDKGAVWDQPREREIGLECYPALWQGLKKAAGMEEK